MSALDWQETDGWSQEANEGCVRCGQPLEARTPNGGCWRCLVGLAILDDSTERMVAAPPEDLPLRYGHFEILLGPDGFPLELGRGSMGITYRARDCNLLSTVALKVITHHVADHPTTRIRFLHEARLTAQLRHPNVASVFHYGEQDGECYYVMELVEGETLDARVRRDGPLTVAQILEVGRQIGRALLAAEAKGLIHRDLKPSNLILNAAPGPAGSAEMVVKVIDFGLAKALEGSALALDSQDTHAGFAGTPAFASPEQHSVYRCLAADDLPVVDSRSDFYSLGVTLWNAACGRVPFAGNSLSEIHRQQVNDPLPTRQLTAAGVPPLVVSFLCRLLAADPRDRPQSARELLAELERCQEAVRARRWRKPRMRLLIFGVCSIVACGWAAFVASHSARRAAVLARPAAVGQEVSLAMQRHPELLPREGGDINLVPTHDPVAYDLYLRACTGNRLLANADEVRRGSLQRVSLLEAAVARDPDFAVAYCELAIAHDEAYYYGKSTSLDERTVDHRTLAEGALQEARRIQPYSGQVHMAQAVHFLFLDDNAHARTEVELARRELPNDADLEFTAGAIAQNQGHWDEATTAFKRAISLKPQQSVYRYKLATLYRCRRDYGEYDRTVAGIIAIDPEHDAVQWLMRSLGPLEESGNLAPLRSALSQLSEADDPGAPLRNIYGLTLSLYERDADAISRRLDEVRPPQLSMGGFLYPKGWYEGWAARLRGDLPGAAAAFAKARAVMQEAVVADPSSGQPLSLLAVLDALLGHEDMAVQEALRACELTPLARLSTAAPVVKCNLAAVYAWTGHRLLAIDILSQLLNRPAGIALPAQPTIGDLKLNPQWDPLSHDEAFMGLQIKTASP